MLFSNSFLTILKDLALRMSLAGQFWDTPKARDTAECVELSAKATERHLKALETPVTSVHHI